MFLIGEIFKTKINIQLVDYIPYKLLILDIPLECFVHFLSRYLHYLEHHKSCNNNHEYGISPTDFNKNEHLRRFYNILATSIDDNGIKICGSD